MESLLQKNNGSEENAREIKLQNGDVESSQNGRNNDEKVAAKVKKSRSFLELSLTHSTANSDMSVGRRNSIMNVGRSNRKVLVLYTGGTIGMVKNRQGVLIPQKGAFENLLRGYPQLHDNACWRQKLQEPGFDTHFLVLPETKELDVRIVYAIKEYKNLMDSANITVTDWQKIAKDIMSNYEEFDGFVVLHGTDTLAYTASALSFMFENIGKCVVLTGSQIPIFEPRSDGADNFVSSLLIAGGLNIPEVTVFFASKLFRGNRSRKISSQNLYAFESPNCVPLVEVGIDMEVNGKAIFKPTVIDKCHLQLEMSGNVGLLRIFPSISAGVIRAFCQPPLEGVVLESYGSGNIPSNRPDIIAEIQAAIKRGVIVVNITQCANGAVSVPVYETGQLLAECGVVSGYDMTPEAALTKLSYVLSKTELTYAQKCEMMSSNIRGELTSTSGSLDVDNTLIDALAQSLNIQTPKKLIEVTEKVFSALLLYAIEHDDERSIKKMLEMGADVNAQNTEGKTPLHEAISRGNISVIEYLLKNGASVHAKSKVGETPLLTAIHKDDVVAIDLLLKCGAHLTNVDQKSVADLESYAARSGCVQKLESLRLAGADLDLVNEMGQTPLHQAVVCNHPEVVKYLLDHSVNANSQDIVGYTPLDYAKKLNRIEMMDMLEKSCSV